MITELRLKNFKCYADTGPVRLRPLTLIIGQNNVGKSTLLQAILMMKQTYEDKEASEPLITSGPLIDLGSFQDILFRGRNGVRRTLSVSLQMSRADTRRVEPPDALSNLTIPVADRLDVRFSFNARRNAVVVSDAQLGNSEGLFLAVRKARAGWAIEGPPAQVQRHIQIAFVNFIPTIQPTGAPPKSATVIKKVLDYSNYSLTQVHTWNHLFEDTQHVEPLRQPVPRYNLLGKMPSSELGAGGENLMRAFRNPSSVIGKSGSLLQQTDYWLSERFEALKKLRMRNVDNSGTVQSLVADERPGSAGVNLADMGSGVSQLLPILASAIAASSNSTVLVEQPEIHLHPKAQSDLGDVFVESLGGSRQFIVETHSEHLILRIRRRIAQGDISPDKVSILFVERLRGVPRITEVRPDRRGHFPAWPRGFFEEGYEESLALAKAASGVRSRRPANG